MRDEIEISG